MFNRLLTLTALSSIVSFAHTEPTCPVGGDASIVMNQGEPEGGEQVVDGVNMYVTTPDNSTQSTDTAVLYLTDVFGINLTENRLLSDSFARAGFITVAPDMFNGQPAPSDLNDPTFDTAAFLAAHGPNVTDPIIDKAITYMRNNFNFTKLAVTGYCYGGRYSFRYVDPKRTIKADVAFAAHPSAWEDNEVSTIGAPISVAAADGDSLMPPDVRARLEGLLANISSPYQLNLYSGVSHGFGVRINTTDPVQVFAKDTAFLQAVRWFRSF